MPKHGEVPSIVVSVAQTRLVEHGRAEVHNVGDGHVCYALVAVGGNVADGYLRFGLGVVRICSTSIRTSECRQCADGYIVVARSGFTQEFDGGGEVGDGGGGYFHFFRDDYFRTVFLEEGYYLVGVGDGVYFVAD